VTGYCFGGRYAIRSVSKVGALGGDVAFAAHPSAWTDPEIGNVTNAFAVALAGKLPNLPQTREVVVLSADLLTYP
jgi:dienelactone hydrolase